MQPERADVFPTTVLANIKWCDSLFVPLCDRLVAAVLALIKLDRDDQKINSSVIADTTQCLIWLGLNKENPKQSTLAVYKHYFEKDFLQATRTYYSAKLTSNVEQMARLTADEFRRCRAYLHHSTKPALAQTLDAVFGEKMPSCDAAEAFSYVRRVRLGDCDRLESGLFDQALRMCNADMTVYLASMQFGKRPPQPSLSSTAEQGWFSHIANYLVAGGTAIDSEVRSRVMPMLVPGHEVPFGLYEAVKLIVDARVKKLAIKSLLPLLCVLDELDRAAQSVEFDGPLSDDARASVRACLFGAMYKHIAESYKLPTNLDSEAALTTAQLFVGTMRQLEFFGGTSLEQDLAVAAVERAIDERMSEDPKMRAKYADRTLRDLKRRLPNLLLSTPEFATASLAKLDGEVEDKRVKIILVGDSGAGKTQIRRRLGGRHAFEGEHKSTDTAEVTSVEVTSLTLASATTWVECDEKDESQRLLLFKAAAAQALVDSAQFTNVNGVMHVRVEDAMCSQGQNDTRNLAVVSDLADLATPASSSVFAAPVAPSCAVASVVCDTVDATTALSTAALSMMPSGAADPGAHMLASTDTLDFEIMDERKVLSLWDFGGQAEYFVVHDLFLTRGALHVLVVDWTKGVEKAREAAQRWLDAIHAHADGALVLAVLPRCREAVDADDNGSDDKRALLDEVSLEIEQLADCALVRVDSATDFNYSALKRELLALVETRLGDSTTHGKVPLRWLRVHDELFRLRVEEKKQWITRMDFRALLQLLQPTQVDDDDVLRALAYLKQSGAVLTSGGGGQVSEYVFLDPDMFFALVRPLINTNERIEELQRELSGQEVSVAFGDYCRTCVATMPLLEYLWRQVESPTQEIGFFVEMLEWCGLMCELRQPGDYGVRRFFVPAANQAQRGATSDITAGLEDAATIGFGSSDEKISALPPSLLPRVVAGLYESGAIAVPSGSCVLGPNSIEVLLLPSGNSDSKGSKRMRLQMAGKHVVLALESGAGDNDETARQWRVDAYVAVHAAITSAVWRVFPALSVRACVWCSVCKQWRALASLEAGKCATCHAPIAHLVDWLPDNDKLIKARRKDWSVVAKSDGPKRFAAPLSATTKNPLILHDLATPKWLFIAIVGSEYTGGLVPLPGSARSALGLAGCVHYKLSAQTFTPIKANDLTSIDDGFDARLKLFGGTPGVVLYLSGHGRRWSDFFVLLLEGSDGTSRRLDLRQYIAALFEKGVQNVLLVVDACYAGAADELANSLSAANRRGLHIFMSSSAGQASYEVGDIGGRFALFTGALCWALEQWARTQTGASSVGALFDALDTILRRRSNLPSARSFGERLIIQPVDSTPNIAIDPDFHAFLASVGSYFTL